MKLLLLIKSPPSPFFRLKDSLDAALTSAVFGQQVSVLFMGAGVEHLQSAADNGLGDLQQYGIEELYAQQDALQRCQPATTAHLPALRAVDDAQIGALLALQHCVLHF